MKDKIFIIPRVDLETATIIEILKKQGWMEGVDLFITEQKENPSWKDLEENIKEKLREISEKKEVKQVETELEKFNFSTKGKWIVLKDKDIEPGVVEGTYEEFLNNPNAKDFKANEQVVKEEINYTGEPIFGINLLGNNPYRNGYDIETVYNYYEYDDINEEDFYHPGKSALEQTAKEIGYYMTVKERFIAEHAVSTKDWNTVIELGNKLKLSTDQLVEIEKEIKMKEAEFKPTEKEGPDKEISSEEGITITGSNEGAKSLLDRMKDFFSKEKAK